MTGTRQPEPGCCFGMLVLCTMLFGAFGLVVALVA